MKRYCKNCGTSLNENVAFCKNCGSAVNTTQDNQSSKSNSLSVNAVANTIGNAIRRNVSASKVSGEVLLGESSLSMGNNILSNLNPIKLIIQEASGYIRSIILSFKDTKKLVLSIVLAVVWIVLIVLRRLGINPFQVQLLSFLTFAQGGISDNVFGMLGGIVGKTLYAYLLASILMPIFRGQNPFKSIWSGIKGAFSRYKNISSNIVLLLTGAGIAMIFYNFMAGVSTLSNSMAAVTGMLLSFRAVSSNGFVTRFFNSLFNRKGKTVDVKGIIAGMSAGFALSILLSAIPYAYTCYLLGVIMLITAFVMFVIRIFKKGALQK